MREDLSKYSLKELQEMKDRRLEESARLQSGEFNKKHRELYIKLFGNIERLDNAIERQRIGEDEV